MLTNAMSNRTRPRHIRPIIDKMWVLLLVPISYILQVEAVVANSGLCASQYEVKPTGLLSCASQLWGNNSENNSCSVWLPVPDKKTNGFSPGSNSAECNAVLFEEHPELKVNFDLVKVKLQAYLNGNASDLIRNPEVAFNVTFSKIRKCKSLKMRFSQNGQNNINFCRDFSITSKEPVPSNSKLFYDCNWSDPTYEDKTFNFEFYANDEISNVVVKYLFRIPNSRFLENKNLSLSEVFMYIDLSQLPYLALRLQMPQGSFNITPDDINVMLHYTNDRGELITENLERTDSTEGDELEFMYDTKSRSGYYQFTAQIDHPDCNGACHMSKTPICVVEADPNERILLIAIVGCGGALLGILSFLFFLWRRRKCALQERPPIVLMIYAPTTSKHVTVVVELAKYLNNVCHVEALVDELHIPKSKTKDPYTWCNDTFSRSDFVMIVSSPYHQCNNYEGIYRNVDALGLRLLKENLGDRSSKRKFFNVVLPYCSDKDLPPEVKNLQRFVLTKDINKMLSYLHTSSVSFYNRFCVQPIVYGGYSELATKGTALLRAMKGAGLELGNKDCICNHSQHRTPLLGDEFVTIDLGQQSAEVNMLPPRENKQVSEEMYPGPIENLNLLGSEGQESHDEMRGNSSRSNVHGAFNLDNMVL